MTDEEREGAPEEDAAAEEPVGGGEPTEGGAEDSPAADTPDAPAADESTTAEEPAAAEEPTAAEAPTTDARPADEPEPAAEAAAEEAANAEPPSTGDADPSADEAPAEAPATGPPMTEPPPSGVRRPVREPSDSAEEVIPGAHLEPDLVLETPSVGDSEESQYARYIEEDQEPVDPEQTLDAEAQEAGAAEPATPADRGPLDLARDARYRATGKRKTSVARVILRPGSGIYTLNGRRLEEFFPRPALQKRAQEALEVVGYASRMDVVARLHGGGVSSQAGALRHGIARALVEADPNLRTDLKRRGFLTRDAREKERRKAGLKKARKRPQFSKR